MRQSVLALSALLILSACDGGSGDRDSDNLTAPIHSAPGQSEQDQPQQGESHPEQGASSGTMPHLETPAAPSRAASSSPGAIPPAFRGYWTGLDIGCGDTSSHMRLGIGAKDLRFYESVGTVATVEQAGPDAVIVDARYEGEGQSWSRRQKLTLSPAGDRLTVANQGNAITRKKCAGPR